MSKTIPQSKIDFIRKNAASSTIPEMAEQLSIAQCTVWKYCVQLRLPFRHSRKVRSDGWSEKDTQFLLENYRKMPVSEIAKKLGRTEKAVTGRWAKVSERADNGKAYRPDSPRITSFRPPASYSNLTQEERINRLLTA